MNYAEGWIVAFRLLLMVVLIGACVQVVACMDEALGNDTRAGCERAGSDVR